MSNTFPWLSIQSQAWERYRFNSLKFEYFTRTGSGTPGSVMLVPDYDPADSAPISEQVASSYEDVVEDAPWKDMCCSLKPSSLHALGPSKFIRSGTLLANLDIKTYDSGNLFVCTVDGTAVNWGKLWVEYDVTLMTPQLHPAGSSLLSAQHITCTAATTASNFNNQVTQPGSTPIVTIIGNVMTFDVAGRFLLTVISTANGGGAVTVTTTPATTGQFLDILNTAASSDNGSGSLIVTQVMALDAVVGDTITFGNTFLNGSAVDVLISKLPSDLDFP
jgi:hypothetical protein